MGCGGGSLSLCLKEGCYLATSPGDAGESGWGKPLQPRFEVEGYSWSVTDTYCGQRTGRVALFPSGCSRACHPTACIAYRPNRFHATLSTVPRIRECAPLAFFPPTLSLPASLSLSPSHWSVVVTDFLRIGRTYWLLLGRTGPPSSAGLDGPQGIPFNVGPPPFPGSTNFSTATHTQRRIGVEMVEQLPALFNESRRKHRVLVHVGAPIQQQAGVTCKAGKRDDARGAPPEWWATGTQHGKRPTVRLV